MEQAVKKIAQQAQLGLLYEVSCFPKPGLVDPIDSGSHNDMDYFTFLESSVVLLPFFEEFIQVGYELKYLPITETFKKIRKIGVLAENEMLHVTQNVNTHKGVIFSLGIFLTICGRLEVWKNDVSLKQFQMEIKEMTCDLLNDFENLPNDKSELTFGEKLFVEHGMTGIRGEAQSGYPSVFDYGLTFYDKYQGKNNEQLIDTLMFLSLHVEDTNLIKRSQSISVFESYREMANNFLELGGYSTESGLNYLNKLNRLLKEKNWSLGGSADTLILVVFVSKLVKLGYLKK
ncbi:triphosphoribosyl-dephospho-CoA synthase CitG [Vagococcus hydrophili]|uniref:Probable 2-(5''-triphosphoribosyl)-3'-dephosphocoenzyme-A synthase n=1 Tax=Vagococcus hydrophili TaxID=2714947 RepID=A0A6G8AU56_9ENTE|nr:triphosphoribosyl-dephospho-CoA synthase CitG [Vagococcus hydrophili]QIL48608.1 triphosphoribosyl-dephospho-CoA synthase CitG [Vagococcus hydrophili]